LFRIFSNNIVITDCIYCLSAKFFPGTRVFSISLEESRTFCHQHSVNNSPKKLMKNWNGISFWVGGYGVRFSRVIFSSRNKWLGRK
jgi:hypothetical protein